MSRGHRNNWRPPWEEEEEAAAEEEARRRTGGGGGCYNYGGGRQRRGCSTTEHNSTDLRGFGGDGRIQRRHYAATSSERQLMRHHQQRHVPYYNQVDPRLSQKREQQRRYHPPPPELYYGGASEKRRESWDNGYDPPEPLDDNYGQVPSVSRLSFDARDRYCTPHQPARMLQQGPYCYDGQVRRQSYRDLYGDLYGDTRRDAAYGVGLPVRAANNSRRAYGGNSPPPLTISTSSGGGGPADDSSDDSQGPGGSLLDPLDGYARRDETPSPPLRHGFKSIDRRDEEPPTKRSTIEVIPGVKMLLRGARETWEAFGRNFCVPVNCIGCSSRVFCIEDADYVLCPFCRVITPVETSSSSRSSGSIGGLGLGFTTGERDGGSAL